MASPRQEEIIRNREREDDKMRQKKREMPYTDIVKSGTIRLGSSDVFRSAKIEKRKLDTIMIPPFIASLKDKTQFMSPPPLEEEPCFYIPPLLPPELTSLEEETLLHHCV